MATYWGMAPKRKRLERGNTVKPFGTMQIRSVPVQRGNQTMASVKEEQTLSW